MIRRTHDTRNLMLPYCCCHSNSRPRRLHKPRSLPFFGCVPRRRKNRKMVSRVIACDEARKITFRLCSQCSLDGQQRARAQQGGVFGNGNAGGIQLGLEVHCPLLVVWCLKLTSTLFRIGVGPAAAAQQRDNERRVSAFRWPLIVLFCVLSLYR